MKLELVCYYESQEWVPHYIHYIFIGNMHFFKNFKSIVWEVQGAWWETFVKTVATQGCYFVGDVSQKWTTHHAINVSNYLT